MDNESKVYFVTVSDDRSGRKGGKYGETQDKIDSWLKNNKIFLGIEKHFSYKWEDIRNSSFYEENKNLLKWVDPDINGRVYKPYVILESLKKINSNDYLIYNDCSPEHWKNTFADFEDLKNENVYDIRILKDNCKNNNDILTIYIENNVNSPFHDPWRGGEGPHTHERMTTPICLEVMNCKKYKHYLQHASGIIILRKNEKTMKFAQEWLHYNSIDKCCSLGDIKELEKNKNYTEIYYKNDVYFKRKSGNLKYWKEGLKKNKRLHGHRHDQSISGLLLNKLNHKLLKIFTPSNENSNIKKNIKDSDFDWKFYLKYYKDLKELNNKKDALMHWNKYGKKSGRICNEKHLKRKFFFSNWCFISYCIKKENYNFIDCSEYFDWKFYVNNYKDLKDSGINNEKDALEHWNKYGKKAGRICNRIKL